MKEFYIRPELEIEDFGYQDIVTLSGIDSGDGEEIELD